MLNSRSDRGPFAFIESCLRHKSEMVIYEAASTIVTLPKISRFEIRSRYIPRYFWCFKRRVGICNQCSPTVLLLTKTCASICCCSHSQQDIDELPAGGDFLQCWSRAINHRPKSLNRNASDYHIVEDRCRVIGGALDEANWHIRQWNQRWVQDCCHWSHTLGVRSISKVFSSSYMAYGQFDKC